MRPERGGLEQSDPIDDDEEPEGSVPAHDLARAQGHLRGVDAAFAPASQAQGQDGSRAFLDDLEDRQGQRPDPPSPILLSMGRR